MTDLAKYIRDVPDFPKEGIIFKDITTLLKDPKAFKDAVDTIAELYKDKGITKVVGIESRGFIFGAPLAYLIGAGFVIVRKPGKLPAETLSESYELEYGTDSIEIHKDAIEPGEKVLIIDDLLATGGTAKATAAVVKKLKGDIIGIAFLIELEFLKGIKKLEEYNITSIIKF
ncbi:adenine phosphoribosyltransferase [Candidatus Dependentiae bacterium]|nr:adenine phosphoribosyltransferase [Candidatus Dependentiae bacterium]